MASVNFLLRSLKGNDPFTARFQFSNPDKISDKNKFGLDFIESKTNIYVFTPAEILDKPLTDGKKFWNKYKAYSGRDLEISKRVVKVLSAQDELRKFILTESENVEKYDKVWLSKVINKYSDNVQNQYGKEQRRKTPKDVLYHFDNYIKLRTGKNKDRTISKLKTQRDLFETFQNYVSGLKGYNVAYEIEDIDPDFQNEYETFLKDVNQYSHNTIAKSIKTLKTICRYASTYGIPLSNRFVLVGLPYERYEAIYLSFEELQSIKDIGIPDNLKNARDWLYLSCFLGQRYGDFMNFNKSMISKDKDGYYIDFIQEKTNKQMHLLLHPTVVEYLISNNFEFPKPILNSDYNEQIKLVCKEAGINEKISGRLMTDVSDDDDDFNLFRKKTGLYEKYKLIGSHIGRKSYCTNFYGLLPTSLIMLVSGHSQETTLRAYIGKKDNTMAELTKDYYKKIDITK